MASRAFVTVIVATLAGAGCGSSCGSKADRASNEAPSLTMIDAAAAQTPEQRAFAALVGRVVSCPWDPVRGISPRCPHLKQLWRSDLLLREELPLGLLGDKDERKRWVGVAALRRGSHYRTDAAMAARVVAAMETETSTAVAIGLADAISRIHLRKTKLVDRVKALIRGHRVAKARQRLLQHTLFYNKQELYDLVAELARNDRDVTVRQRAIQALFTGTPEGRHGDSCALWNEVIAAADPLIAALGATLVTRYGRGLCKDHYDRALALVEQRARAGTVKVEQLPDTLRNIYMQNEATAAQKQRALDIALALLGKPSNHGPARARALELLFRYHPKGKQLVKAHLQDANGFVKRRAERLDKYLATARQPKPGSKPTSVPKR